jgi:hypothetical protein
VKGLATLAKMLGVPARLAEDALHSESAARAVLSRRNLFAASSALAVGSLLVGGPLPLRVFHDGCTWYAANSWADYRDLLADDYFGGVETDGEEVTELFDNSYEEPLHRVVNVCWDPDDDSISDSSEHSRRAPFDYWANREGRGILFSTEY